MVDLEKLYFYQENYPSADTIKLAMAYVKAAGDDEDVISDIAWVLGQCYMDSGKWDTAAFWLITSGKDEALPQINRCRKHLGLPFVE